MKSFGILRTNVGLTTNVKIMIDSSYSLSLDSIDSEPNLSFDRFKKMDFNKNDLYDELIPSFYNNIPTDISYHIKYDDDNDNMNNDFKTQYDDIYQYGARNIVDNKNYKEEYEYFAPLYINKEGIPSNFIIFRVDGPGLITLNKDNFRDEIVNKLKTVKLFDLSKKTNLGEWLYKNVIENSYFPITPLEIDYRRLEFSRWNGIDYDNGGYTSKSLFMDDIFSKENEIFELEKLVFENYKNLKVVFPNIMNFSFLFDDTPSTPTDVRKWSINRYYGFYFDDMTQYETISPYNPTPLRNDIIINDKNEIYSEEFGYPFYEEWSDKKPFLIEYNGTYYKVEQFEDVVENQLIKTKNSDNVKISNIKLINTNTKLSVEEYGDKKITKYRIISDFSLYNKTFSDFNNNYGIITDNILNIDIDIFDNYDIWLIEINGVFHNIIKKDNAYVLNTDYSFTFFQNYYEYKVGGNSTKINTDVDFDNEPKLFKIYYFNFTDVKDFDDRIIDTDYSKYEYEEKDNITNTDEPKFYMEDLESVSNPKEIDSFIYKNNNVHIPVSSEYTANYETFKIYNNTLSDIWRKNSIYCRFSFKNSLSNNDKPYVLNNSFIFEDYNNSCNINDPNPKRYERNLDYFYSYNNSNSIYEHHTLHINNQFSLSDYITDNINHFEFLFKTQSSFNEKIRNVNKYSSINGGDADITNHTLFRGLKFNFYEVDNINYDNGILSANYKNTNALTDYKFSILLGKTNQSIINGGLTSSNNNLSWVVINQWDMDTIYPEDSYVLFDDILYKNTGIKNPSAPTNDLGIITSPKNTGWDYVTDHIFWFPGTTNKIVYNSGEYYYDNSGVCDFWSPSEEYALGDEVMFKNKWFKSTINLNTNKPTQEGWIELREASISSKWVKIPLWNPSVSHIGYVIYDDSVYYFENASIMGQTPSVIIYSLVPKTDYLYSRDKNPIIYMNNKYYLSTNESDGKSTLDNNITIYINKVFKNILIHINVADNTLTNLEDINRDYLYNDLYKKLTACNFINCVNDITKPYGFSDSLSYVVIGNDGIKKYDINNITGIPFIAVCDNPDSIKVKTNSLIKEVVDKPKALNSLKVLKNSTILNYDMLDFYNNNAVAVNIKDDESVLNEFEIIYGGNNISNTTLYRYSGWYEPLFYNISLFNSNNSKFKTELDEFGIMKERKISKINRNGSILKLRNEVDEKSIYPMLDEYGYSIQDFFIFTSSWDMKYYNETKLILPSIHIDYLKKNNK